MVRKLTAALALTLVVFAAAPASAQYPSGVTIEIDDPTVIAGQTVTLSGVCDTGAGEVVFTINGVEIGRAPIIPGTDDGDPGTYSVSVTIPGNLAPGTYQITATCGDAVATTDVTVQGQSVTAPPTTTGGGGNLARTGTETDELVRIGAVLLVVGAGLTLLASKRRRSHALD